MSEDRDLLDDVVDRALALYGQGEPRPGLEGRVVATLRARPPLPWWRALFAGRRAAFALGALAVAGVVAAFVLVPHPRTRQTGAPGLAPPAAEPIRPADLVEAAPPVPAPARVEPPAAPAKRRAATWLVSTARVPRRTSFPGHRPLSEQERLLLRYVAEAPREEVEPRSGFLDAPAPLPDLPDPNTEP